MKHFWLLVALAFVSCFGEQPFPTVYPTNAPAYCEWRPELAWDAGAVCGVGFLNTGPNDPLRLACALHDHCYDAHHAGDHSMSLFDCDAAFNKAMDAIAGDDFSLQCRAKTFEGLVYTFGWIPWIRNNK